MIGNFFEWVLGLFSKKMNVEDNFFSSLKKLQVRTFYINIFKNLYIFFYLNNF
jgi:hypothetical protein